MTKRRRKILIADDSEMNRLFLADMLGDEFQIIEATNGRQALDIIEKVGTSLDVVLLDIVMPEMDGFAVLADMNRTKWIDKIPVIMISSENTASYIHRAYELGAVDYITRPFDDIVVKKRVVNTIMLYARQKQLIGIIAEQVYEKERSNSLMVSILSHIVEFRNAESGLHVLHINTMTEILLNALMKRTDKYHLSEADVMVISMASSLHDIGKISIPSEVLNKPGKLTKEEFELVKTHTTVGAEMLDSVPFGKNEALMKYAYQICRWHHERYDGNGYPDGLKGEEIPIAAQIVALADVYDALTSERVYKPPYPHKKAIDMIANGECGVFNPLLLECLMDVAPVLEKELAVTSLSSKEKGQIRKATEEILKNNHVLDSESSLQMSSREQIDPLEFEELMKEGRFEYNEESDLLIFSEWTARILGVSEVMTTPKENKKIQKMLLDVESKITKEYPIVKTGFLSSNGITEQKFDVIIKGIWNENGKLTKYIGKVKLLGNE